VALRLSRAFAEVSVGQRRARLLVGAGRAPFATYKLTNGDEVRLWYQAWRQVSVRLSIARHERGIGSRAGELDQTL
jgi:hypothetical protein